MVSGCRLRLFSYIWAPYRRQHANWELVNSLRKAMLSAAVRERGSLSRIAASCGARVCAIRTGASRDAVVAFQVVSFTRDSGSKIVLALVTLVASLYYWTVHRPYRFPRQTQPTICLNGATPRCRCPSQTSCC